MKEVELVKRMTFTLRLDKDLWTYVGKESQRTSRSMNGMINAIIRKAMNEQKGE